MNLHFDMPSSPLRFSSKADTLAHLANHEDLHVPPVFTLSAAQWRVDRSSVLALVAATFAGRGLAVRSSCRREDGHDVSGAGAFTSVLDVPADEPERLAQAVERVLASYGEAAPDDQVLIQPMVPDIIVSGVIMTRAHGDGAPYYVINYDDSGKPDAITGGATASKTVFIYRGASEQHCDSRQLRAFLGLARRVEAITGHDELDMEFCLDRSGDLHLLQVRPICAQSRWIPDADRAVRSKIDFVVEFISQRMRPWPGLYGQRTILGVMPDWNPAEMIGTTPRLLAASLYRELITRRVWSRARERMGYRAMPPEELMVLVAGRPYIDVRVSFNSFLPDGLDPVTGEALVAAWLDRLDAHPELHDKVEFEVCQTALDFCFDQHLDQRYPDLLTNGRRVAFRSALLAFTAKCLAPDRSSSLDWAFDAILELRNRQATRPLPVGRDQGRPASPGVGELSRIALLAEECRHFGTLPFSILARHGFIAESLLRTAEHRGALAPERLAAFKASIRTVSGEMSSDFMAVCRHALLPEHFLARYGHLRPGSYDILSPRYMDREGLFVDPENIAHPETPCSAFQLTQAEQQNFDHLLREAGFLQITPDDLLTYSRRAIAGRELAKFVFTRNLSDMLEHLADWAAGFGLDRDDLSYLDIRDIVEWTTRALLRPPRQHFQELAAKGRELFDLGRSIKLGYLIRSPRDVYVVPQHRSAPNFVGAAKIEAPIIRLGADSSCGMDLEGRIVCIENADPGFDWIFTRSIAGLVTMFGGANSHMAIRCAEYGLPAAIGVGERLFEQLLQSRACLLDAGAGVLQPLAEC
ncbi:PEP-utilizing enzyme [Desulfonatronum parangueonense]